MYICIKETEHGAANVSLMACSLLFPAIPLCVSHQRTYCSAPAATLRLQASSAVRTVQDAFCGAYAP